MNGGDERTARPRRPMPSPFTATDADWMAALRSRTAGGPPWSFDRDWINSVALEHLPAVVAAMGYSDVLGIIPRPVWWSGWRDFPVHRDGLRLPDLAQCVILQSTRDGDALTFIDRATGEWQAPSLTLQGDDLVALGAWRWAMSGTKAAWRLARICRQRVPRP